MKRIVALVAMVISSVGLQAQEADKPTPSADKKICKMLTPTGTIMAKRICLTKREWAEFNERNREDSENALRHRGSGTCDGGLENPRCGN